MIRYLNHALAKYFPKEISMSFESGEQRMYAFLV